MNLRKAISPNFYLWMEDGLFVRPTSFQSMPDSGSGKSGYLRPLFKAFRFTIYGEKIDIPSISLLLGPSGPSNIAGFVVSRITDSIQGVLWAWSRTNIFKKSRKGMPWLVQGNSTTSVIRPTFVSWITGPGLHGSPYRILRNAKHSMLCKFCRNSVSLLTSATSPIWAIAWRNHSNHFSAVTNAFPNWDSFSPLAWFTSYFLNKRKSASASTGIVKHSQWYYAITPQVNREGKQV